MLDIYRVAPFPPADEEPTTVALHEAGVFETSDEREDSFCLM